jgi:hypothetical protein
MLSERELALLDAPDDELDLLLGEALVADEFGAKDLSDTEKRAAGRRWFDAHLAEFRHAICVESPLRAKLFSAEKMERTALFAAVVDTLGTGALGLPVPVAVLSARLIKYGLDKLCAEAAAE